MDRRIFMKLAGLTVAGGVSGILKAKPAPHLTAQEAVRMVNNKLQTHIDLARGDAYWMKVYFDPETKDIICEKIKVKDVYKYF